MLPRETIDAFRRGDRTAFEIVLRTYAHVVRRVAGACFKSTFDREEAMQEVWLHIWKNRDAVDVDRAQELGGWIAVVARRRCLDLLRRPQSDVPLEEVPEPEAEAVVDVAEQRDIQAAVAGFASSLKPGWRRFFDLHFVQGLPYEDVGAQLGIGKLRCRYMKKVLAARARKNRPLLDALQRSSTGGRHAS